MSDDPDDGGVPNGGRPDGMGGDGGTTSMGGGSGVCSYAECWDGSVCRTDPTNSDCPETYELALATRDGGDDTACAGPIANGFGYLLNSAFQQLLCEYDTAGNLRGFSLADDCNCHCGGESFSVVGGTAQRALVLEDVDRYGYECFAFGPLSMRSVSPLFNEEFPAITRTGACEPASDQCRSSTVLLVCEAASDGAACGGCRADEDCFAEYPYIARSEITCERGLCHLSAHPIGQCDWSAPTTVCRTARGEFVCDGELCDRCRTDEQCRDTTGDTLATCSDDGSCIASR